MVPWQLYILVPLIHPIIDIFNRDNARIRLLPTSTATTSRAYTLITSEQLSTTGDSIMGCNLGTLELNIIYTPTSGATP